MDTNRMPEYITSIEVTKEGEVRIEFKEEQSLEETAQIKAWLTHMFKGADEGV